MKRIVPWVVVALSYLAAPSLAAIPQTLSYQGVLTDGLGHVVPDGNYRITFRIYDDPIVGALLWTEAHDGVTAPVVPVSRGGFSVVLGDVVPVSVAFNGPRWLEIQVAPDPTPLTPRTALTPAPYSLNTRNVFDGGSNDFVGVGRQNPLTGAEYFGVLAPVAAGYGGMYLQTQGATGKPFYGYAAGFTTAWTYLDGSDGNKWKLNNNGDRVTVTNTGDVGIGTDSPTTRLEVAGGTKLGGPTAPAIKIAKFTGTSSASPSGFVTISTGIPGDKILAIDAMVSYGPGSFVCPGYTYNVGYQFNWYQSGSDIFVVNINGNSANILSKPIKLLVTYEE